MDERVFAAARRRGICKQRWALHHVVAHTNAACSVWQVPVSISDTGDFVGPEPLQRWGTVPGADPATEPMVLARPATKTLLFRDLIEFYDAFKEMLRVNASASLPSLYMEYMPLSALGDGSLTEDVLPIRWSRFLNLKLMLLWLGGGGSRKNGRLHFDNYENLMTVVLGKKTFMLYDPAQSARVYADMPMRPANLEAQLEPQTMECGADGYCAGIGLRKWSFQRRSNKVINVSSSVHTYSPVDVLRPDYNLFPLLRMLKGFNCTLYEVCQSPWMSYVLFADMWLRLHLNSGRYDLCSKCVVA